MRLKKCNDYHIYLVDRLWDLSYEGENRGKKRKRKIKFDILDVSSLLIPNLEKLLKTLMVHMTVKLCYLIVVDRTFIMRILSLFKLIQLLLLLLCKFNNHANVHVFVITILSLFLLWRSSHRHQKLVQSHSTSLTMPDFVTNKEFRIE